MNDVGYALRQVVRRPGLSAVVIVMLAIGIGSTTAMFSLFETFMLRPLPVADPERLVNLSAPGPKPGSTSIGYAGELDAVFSYPMFRDLEAQQSVFTGLAAIARSTRISPTTAAASLELASSCRAATSKRWDLRPLWAGS